MDPLIVGMDLGTTLCKASAFELNGDCLASSYKAIKMHRPHPGWAEQDPLDWKRAVLDVLGELVTKLGKDADRIEGIGLSSHGPSLIILDEDRNPIGRSPTWQDQRAAPLIDALIDIAGVDWVGLGPPESSFGVQLFWVIRNRPSWLQGAAYILDTKGYLLGLLTGRVVDEPSSSPAGTLANQALFESLGISPRVMASSVPSVSVVGELTSEILELTNLPRAVKVVAGLNDGAAATLGAGIVALGQGIVSLSTNGVLRTTVSRAMPGSLLYARSMFCYPYIDQMFVTGGMTKCGGDSIQWFIENFHPDRAGDPEIFNLIAEEASSSPVGANGVLFLPYLVGMGTPNPSKTPQGAFLNLAREHIRGDLTRAVLEGSAYAIKDIGRTFDELGLNWENISFTGGGSKNPSWRQIVADILGKPLTGARSDSVLGDALVAATALGRFSTIKDGVQSMVAQTFSVSPIPENIRNYQDRYAQYRQFKTLVSNFSVEGSQE